MRFYCFLCVLFFLFIIVLCFYYIQDFVWGFALLISGLMLLYLVIRYGVRNYRQTLYNNYSTDDWHLGILWQLLIK